MATSLPLIIKDTLREILRQLDVAERQILVLLRGVTDVDRARRLARQRSEIARLIEIFRKASDAATRSGLDTAWQAGAAAVRDQVAAAVRAIDPTGRINPGVLLAMRNFLTDRISDVSREAIERINSALAQHLLGVRQLSATITEIERILGGGTRRRAMTIANTEIGRAYSAAQYEQMLEQAKILPGLKKQWVHSGKEHGRPGHIIAATYPPIPVDEPFEIVDVKTGEIELLRYPRDPEASAGNTINCGCMMIAVPPPLGEYVPLKPGDLVKAGTVVRNGQAQPLPLQITSNDEGLLAAAARERATLDFIKAARSTPAGAKQPMQPIGAIPSSFAESLRAIGLDPGARVLGLDHDSTRHLFRAHGAESELLRGQLPITAQDLLKVPSLLDGASSVRPGNPPRARDGARLVDVTAEDAGNRYVIVLKMRRQEMTVQTMYKRKQ